jgi:hypothetical protein
MPKAQQQQQQHHPGSNAAPASFSYQADGLPSTVQPGPEVSDHQLPPQSQSQPQDAYYNATIRPALAMRFTPHNQQQQHSPQFGDQIQNVYAAQNHQLSGPSQVLQAPSIDHSHCDSHAHDQPLPKQPPMEASSINVSTACYPAPRPHGHAKKEGVQLDSSTSSQTSTSAVKLAAVPRKLASRSIISLNPSYIAVAATNTTPSLSSPALHHTRIGGIGMQSQSQSQSGSERAFHEQERLLLSKNKTATTPTSSKLITISPTTEQVHQRKQSSYSSACDATILAQAQQERLRLECRTMSLTDVVEQTQPVQAQVQENSVVVALTGGVVAGNESHKRTSPDPERKEHSKHHKYVKVVGGKPAANMNKTPASISNQTLQQYLANLLTSRGYSTQHYCSLEGGYYCKPTELQKASYGMKLIQAVRTSDAILLRRLLSAGLSPNPCNAFGESIIHMVCRRGDWKLLNIFLEFGCSVQVSDDFGRTPFHDACWTTKPCFPSVELLLNRDVRLLHVVDCRGSAPLSYVKQENWGEWMEFFDSQKDIWWPVRNVSLSGEEDPPELVSRAPHSLPLPDPKRAALCEVAKLISSGSVEPESVNVNVDLEGAEGVGGAVSGENAVISPSLSIAT